MHSLVSRVEWTQENASNGGEGIECVLGVGGACTHGAHSAVEVHTGFVIHTLTAHHGAKINTEHVNLRYF